MTWWKNSDDERFWIYLAGIIDGEGTIGIYGNKRPDSRPALRPSISISNTDERLIDAIMTTLPNSIYLSRAKSRKEKHHKFQLNIRIENYFSVLYVLKKIIPYLIIKKKQAEIMLKFVLLRNGQKTLSGGYRHYGNKEYELCSEMKKLNQKGVVNE